jgi:NAD(P)-dependent dehydrogenase (short-subunit alcohol dehydrogenase family)
MTQFNFSTTSTEVAEALAQEIKDKTVLITGVTKGGLGRETARAISLHGPKLLILAARSQEKLAAAAEELKKAAPNVEVRGLQLDLSSQAAVRTAAAEVNAYPEDVVIDVLINNAGIMATPFGLSPEGIEMQFATNHIGHWLFTNLIMPRILAAAKAHGQARIVNLSSQGHRRGGVRFDDWNFNGGAGKGSDGSTYDHFLAYGQSKTANILTAVYLADKLKNHGVLAYSLHPGVIFTNLGQRAAPEAWEAFRGTGLLDENLKPRDTEHTKWKTLEQGAATSVVAAFDPSIKDQSGAYLSDGNVDATVEGFATDNGNAEKLWKLSEQLTGEKFEY